MAKKKKEETLSDILDRIEDDIANLRDKVEELETEKDSDDDFEDDDFDDEDSEEDE